MTPLWLPGVVTCSAEPLQWCRRAWVSESSGEHGWQPSELFMKLASCEGTSARGRRSRCRRTPIGHLPGVVVLTFHPSPSSPSCDGAGFPERTRKGVLVTRTHVGRRRAKRGKRCVS